MRKPSDEDTCEAVYTTLMKKCTDDVFRILIQAAKETGNGHIANLLQEENNECIDGGETKKKLKHDTLRQWYPKKKELIKSFVERKIGTEVIVDKLREIMQQNETKPDVGARTAAITGLGGVGKTTIAIQFADKYEKVYSHIIWIECGEQQLDNSIRQLADKLKIRLLDGASNSKFSKDLVVEIFETLEEFDCLFIFDNVDKYKSIEDFLPGNNLHHTIITSRSQYWGSKLDYGQIATIQLSVFCKEEAVSFVRKVLEEPGDDLEEFELSEELGYLPLALRIAVATIQQNHWTIKKYLDQRKLNAYKLFMHETESVYGMPLYKSLGVTIDVIVATEDFESNAINILNIFAFLVPDSIQKSFIIEVVHKSDCDIDFALSLLRKYSLITVLGTEEGEVFSIHRLLQEVVRYRMELQTTINVLSNLTENLKAHYMENNYYSHICSVWNFAVEHDEIVDLFLGFFKTVVNKRGNKQRRVESSDFLSKSLVQLTRVVGATHQVTLKTRDAVAHSLFQMGKYGESQNQWKHIISVLKEHHPAPGVISLSNIKTKQFGIAANFNIGVVEERMGNFDTAMSIYTSNFDNKFCSEYSRLIEVNLEAEFGDMTEIVIPPLEVESYLPLTFELRCKLVTMLIKMNKFEEALEQWNASFEMSGTGCKDFWKHNSGIIMVAGFKLLRYIYNFPDKSCGIRSQNAAAIFCFLWLGYESIRNGIQPASQLIYKSELLMLAESITPRFLDWNTSFGLGEELYSKGISTLVLKLWENVIRILSDNSVTPPDEQIIRSKHCHFYSALNIATFHKKSGNIKKFTDYLAVARSVGLPIEVISSDINTSANSGVMKIQQGQFTEAVTLIRDILRKWNLCEGSTKGKLNCIEVDFNQWKLDLQPVQMDELVLKNELKCLTIYATLHSGEIESALTECSLFHCDRWWENIEKAALIVTMQLFCAAGLQIYEKDYSNKVLCTLLQILKEIYTKDKIIYAECIVSLKTFGNGYSIIPNEVWEFLNAVINDEKYESNHLELNGPVSKDQQRYELKDSQFTESLSKAMPQFNEILGPDHILLQRIEDILQKKMIEFSNVQQFCRKMIQLINLGEPGEAWELWDSEGKQFFLDMKNWNNIVPVSDHLAVTLIQNDRCNAVHSLYAGLYCCIFDDCIEVEAWNGDDLQLPGSVNSEIVNLLDNNSFTNENMKKAAEYIHKITFIVKGTQSLHMGRTQYGDTNENLIPPDAVQKQLSMKGESVQNMKVLKTIYSEIESRTLRSIEFKYVQFHKCELIAALKNCTQLESLVLEEVDMIGGCRDRVYLPELKVFVIQLANWESWEVLIQKHGWFPVVNSVSFFYKDVQMKTWKLNNYNHLNLEAYSVHADTQRIAITSSGQSLECHGFEATEVLQCLDFSPTKLILKDCRLYINMSTQIFHSLKHLVLFHVTLIVEKKTTGIELGQGLLKYFPNLEILDVSSTFSARMSIKVSSFPPKLQKLRLGSIKLLYGNNSDAGILQQNVFHCSSSPPNIQLNCICLDGINLPTDEMEIQQLFRTCQKVLIHANSTENKVTASFLEKLMKIHSIQFIYIRILHWRFEDENGNMSEFPHWLKQLGATSDTVYFCLNRLPDGPENEKTGNEFQWQGRNIDYSEFNSISNELFK